jgi:hypothetical protein
MLDWVTCSIMFVERRMCGTRSVESEGVTRDNIEKSSGRTVGNALGCKPANVALAR